MFISHAVLKCAVNFKTTVSDKPTSKSHLFVYVEQYCFQHYIEDTGSPSLYSWTVRDNHLYYFTMALRQLQVSESKC